MRMVLIALLILLLSNPVWATDWCEHANIVGCWTLEEGTGTSTSDVSANSYDGTLTGSGDPTWSTDVPTGINSTQSIDFAGAGYINYGEIDDTNGTNDFSFVTWVKLDSLTSDHRIFSRFDGGAFNNQFIFWMDTGGSGDGWAGNLYPGSSTAFSSIGVNNTDASTDWQHVAYSYNGTAFKIYVDGSETATDTVSTSFRADMTRDTHAGVLLSSSQYTSGLMDDQAEFSSGLSSTDINDIMDNGLIPAGGSAPAGINLFGTVEIY